MFSKFLVMPIVIPKLILAQHCSNSSRDILYVHSGEVLQFDCKHLALYSVANFVSFLMTCEVMVL